MGLYLPVILGTEREGRKSEAVARYLHAKLADRPSVTTRFLDPRELKFGNLEHRAVDVADAADPNMADFIKDMHRADGFLIVTPDYNYLVNDLNLYGWGRFGTGWKGVPRNQPQPSGGWGPEAPKLSGWIR